MTEIYGTVIDVSTTNVGESVVADVQLTGGGFVGGFVGGFIASAVSSGPANVITVTDATTFDELGGQLRIGDVVYTYTSIDPVANTITLTSDLVVSAVTDDYVEVYPPAPIKRALVDLGVDGGESILVTVPHDLSAMLDDGMREDADREVVLLEERSVGEVYLKDVTAQPATVSIEGLPDEVEELVSDGIAPSASPNPVLDSMIGALHVHWLGVVNHDFVTYEIHISTVSGFTPDASTLTGTTNATSYTIRTLPSDLLLAYDTTYYVRLIASDADGAASPSAEAAGQIRKATTADIAANYVYAGSILADQITGGTVTGDVLIGGAFSFGVPGGAGGSLDASGFTLRDPSGVPATVLTPENSVFKGDAEIDGLTVKSSMSIRGTANEISSGGELSLAGSVTPASTAPTVVTSWDSIPFTKTGDATFNAANLTSIARVASLWVCGYRENATTYRIYRFNADGTFHSVGMNPYTGDLAADIASTQIVANGQIYSATSNGYLVRHGTSSASTLSDDFTSEVNAATWPTRTNVTWDAGRAKITEGLLRSVYNKDVEDSFVSAKMARSGSTGNGQQMTMRLVIAGETVASIYTEGSLIKFSYGPETLDEVAFVAAAANYDVGAGTTVTVNRPAGTSTGDLLIGAMAQDFRNTTAVPNNMAMPAGWNKIGNGGSSATGYVSLWSHVAEAGDPSSWAFSDLSGAGENCDVAAAILAFSDWDTTQALTPTFAEDTGFHTSFTAPSVTGHVGGMQMCGYAALDYHSRTASFSVYSGGQAERVDMPTAVSTFANMAVATESLTADGATGTRSCVGSHSSWGVTWSLPIRPSSAAGAELTYSATTHAYWRISEAAGIIYFWTSADGVSWTQRYSHTHDLTDPEMAATAFEFQNAYGAYPAQVVHVDTVRHGVVTENLVVPYSRINTAYRPAIGNDGTNLLVAETHPSNNTVRIQTVSPTTLLPTATVTSTANSGFAGQLVGVLKGTFDLGVTRYFVKAPSYIWYCLDTAGAQVSGSNFAADNGGSKWIGWDGAYFHALGTDGKLYKHTAINPAGASTAIAYAAAFTWYDSNATGGTHETTISPVANFELKKRAKVTVTGSSVPPIVGSDDINSVRIYLGVTGATLKLQSTTAVGVTSAVYETINTGGAAPPVSNNFPAAAAARIVNPADTLIISGDGSIVATKVRSTGFYYGEATATTNNTFTVATVTDIIGATLTVPVAATTDVYWIDGVYEIQNVTTAGGDMTGRLSVNGVEQTKQVLWNSADNAGTRRTLRQRWRVTGLAAGNRVFKLTVAGPIGVYQINITRTTITVEQTA